LVEKREQVNRAWIGISEGENDAVSVAVDGEIGDTKGEREVIGQATDLGEAGVGFGVEEEADETRADGAAGDPSFGPVGVEHGFDTIGLIFKIRTNGFGHKHSPTVTIKTG
jgi:hypothetical protein